MVQCSPSPWRGGPAGSLLGFDEEAVAWRFFVLTRLCSGYEQGPVSNHRLSPQSSTTAAKTATALRTALVKMDPQVRRGLWHGLPHRPLEARSEPGKKEALSTVRRSRETGMRYLGASG